MKDLPNISIYSRIGLDTELFDHRIYTYGFSFGKVRDICGQYGIIIENMGDFNRFSAPKLRLQLLIEKLHFSKKKYSIKPL